MLLSAPATAQTDTIDVRQASRPAVRLSALESCPVVFGVESAEIPTGLVSCAGAVRLSGGNVVILDATARRMYIFDSTGKLLARAGRGGQGPGEFSGTPTLFPYRGDSLLVLAGQPRGRADFLVFSPLGHYARSFSHEMDLPPGTRPAIAGASIRDGSIAISSLASPKPASGSIAGLDSLGVTLVDPRGIRVTATSFAPNAMWAQDITVTPGPAAENGARTFGMSIRLMSPGPVSRARGGLSLTDATVALHGGPLYHFEEPTDALVVYLADGREIRRILVPPLAARLRPSHDRVRPQGEVQLLHLTSDNVGRAWLELARDRLDSPRRWWIIEPDGKLVAEVLTPANQELLYAGENSVLLLRKDRDGVQTVALCTLVPSR